jgi:magnesium transporter
VDSEIFVWVALFDPDPAELFELQKEFAIHSLAIEDVVHGNQRPKVEEYGDSIYVVAHAFETESIELRRGEVHIIAGKNFVLSIRKNYNVSFSDVRERCEREPHFLSLGSGFILYSLLDTVVDRYFPIVEAFETDLEIIEESIFKQKSYQKNIERLYLLKQKILMLHHSTSSLLEALNKLHGGRVPSICQDAQDYFRDINDHLVRIRQSIENTRELLITAIQVNLTMISLAEGKVSKKLAAWAAIIAIPTLIAGVYGMNFKHMPELDHPWGYPTTLISMIAIDIYLFYRFKKADWL